MKFFIKGIDRGIWRAMKESLFFPTHEDDVEINKPEKDLSKDDKENVQCSLKEKTVITTALGLDEFLQVSHHESEKEM